MTIPGPSTNSAGDPAPPHSPLRAEPGEPDDVPPGVSPLLVQPVHSQISQDRSSPGEPVRAGARCVSRALPVTSIATAKLGAGR
jgi:hypothetical protein